MLQVFKFIRLVRLVRFLRILAIIFIANTTHNTSANESTNTWQGVVTYVTDGDTLRVRPAGANEKLATLRVRINGIDAPEICQLYGAESAAALKKLLMSKQVTVSNKRLDDYGRYIADVTVDDLDVGAWMVENGHAWSHHYRFSDGLYGPEEKAAIRQKLGLFVDASAVEPKIFRRQHGSCYFPVKNDRKRDN